MFSLVFWKGQHLNLPPFVSSCYYCYLPSAVCVCLFLWICFSKNTFSGEKKKSDNFYPVFSPIKPMVALWKKNPEPGQRQIHPESESWCLFGTTWRKSRSLMWWQSAGSEESAAKTINIKKLTQNFCQNSQKELR